MINAGTYGDLVAGQDITLTLEGGVGNEFIFNSITTSGNTRLNIDLSGGEVNIKGVGDISFGQDAQIFVQESAGSGYVRLDTVPHLADKINWETARKFILGGGDGVTVGQRVDWYGTIYATDDIHLADHSRYTSVAAIPLPTAVRLFGSALLGLAAVKRRKA